MSTTLNDTDACELELQQLMERILSTPLEPIRQRLQILEERLQETEDLCRDTAEAALPALHNVLTGDKDSLASGISRLRTQLGKTATQVNELIEAGLPDSPEQLRILETAQQAAQQALDRSLETLKTLQTESQAHQTLLQTQMQRSLETLDTSSNHTRQTLADLASLGTQLTVLSQGQTDAHTATAAHVTHALVTVQEAEQVRQNDLKASLATLSNALAETRQDMHIRTERLSRWILWLGVGCGTGLVATLGLLAALIFQSSVPR
ncbi:hypothetical protein ACU6VJ_15805 [Sphaerotilus sulfidivorans]